MSEIKKLKSVEILQFFVRAVDNKDKDKESELYSEIIERMSTIPSNKNILSFLEAPDHINLACYPMMLLIDSDGKILTQKNSPIFKYRIVVPIVKSIKLNSQKDTNTIHDREDKYYKFVGCYNGIYLVYQEM